MPVNASLCILKMSMKKVIEKFEIERRPPNSVFKVNDRHNHRLVIKLPGVRPGNDFFKVDISYTTMTEYRDLVFFTEAEANAWIEENGFEFNPPLRIVKDRAGWEEFVKIPLQDGKIVHMNKWGLPRDPSVSPVYAIFPSQGQTRSWCEKWWEKMAKLYPDCFAKKNSASFFEDLIDKDFTSSQITSIMDDPNLNDEQKCKKLFDRDFEHVKECVNANFDKRNYPQYYDVKRAVPAVYHYSLFFLGNPNSPLTLTQSWNVYVNGKFNDDFPYDVSWAREYSSKYGPFNWWKYIKKSVEVWEETLGLPIPGKAGLFESLRELPGDLVKKVIFNYVQRHGYIKGDWTGRFPIESPTVVKLYNILKAEDNDDIEDYKEDSPKYEEFKRWMDSLKVNMQDADPDLIQSSSLKDWVNKSIMSWEKESKFTKADIKNLVSICSFFIKTDSKKSNHENSGLNNTWAGTINDEVIVKVVSAVYKYPPWGRDFLVTGEDNRLYEFKSSKTTLTLEELNSGEISIKGKINVFLTRGGQKVTGLKDVVKIDVNSKAGFF